MKPPGGPGGPGGPKDPGGPGGPGGRGPGPGTGPGPGPGPGAAGPTFDWGVSVTSNISKSTILNFFLFAKYSVGSPRCTLVASKSYPKNDSQSSNLDLMTMSYLPIQIRSPAAVGAVSSLNGAALVDLPLYWNLRFFVKW